MIIAVAYENKQVFNHFGHTKEFKVYKVEGEKVISEEMVSPNGKGREALVACLKHVNAEQLICGSICTGAKNALEEIGIEVYPGVSGDADEMAKKLIRGELKFNPEGVRTNVKCSDEAH